MKKQAVILFSADPRKDALLKGRTPVEAVQLEKEIHNIIESYAAIFQSEEYDLLLCSDITFVLDSKTNGFKKRYIQRGDCFGKKFANAFIDAFVFGYDKVIVIGNDTFGISGGKLINSFNKLDISDAVLGPSKDGGFYLLALSKEAFERIDWNKISRIKYRRGKDLKELSKYFYSIGLEFNLLKKLCDADSYSQFIAELSKRIYLTLYYGICQNTLIECLKFQFAFTLFIISKRCAFTEKHLKAPPLF